MYVPAKFSVTDEEAWNIVEDAGAGMLVVAGPEGLASVFVPVIVSEDRRTMLSHLAKANPWWKVVTAGSEVLALFVAASAYVSPTNYPSKDENPNVVPTWNYSAAEVRGTLVLHEDLEWKLSQVRDLTHRFERDRDPQWPFEEMDEGYRDSQLKAIVGIEINVASIEGKAKLSQNRPDVDRLKVRENFDHGNLVERIVAARMHVDD